MLRTCPSCGTMHDHNKICHKNKYRNKKDTEANKFRKTTKWTKKSVAIRERDKYLCRCCIANIYETNYVYNFDNLEVHHIVPLEEDFSLRLDDGNLITLCAYHHKFAEDRTISREILKLLTNPECNLDKVKAMATAGDIPPTFGD